MVRREWWFVVCAMFVAGSFACSGTSGDDDGGGNNGEAGSYPVNIGTCLVMDNDDVDTCSEYWHVDNGEAGAFRQFQAGRCQGDDATWTAREAVCPTSGNFSGACVAGNESVKRKLHHYNLQTVDAAKSACEEDGHTWVTE